MNLGLQNKEPSYKKEKVFMLSFSPEIQAFFENLIAKLSEEFKFNLFRTIVITRDFT